MFAIFSVFYILIAAAMIVLILMQRGAGAEAGSGFGAGASSTVFGARGSSNFLTRTTGVLATVFFLMSLGMGMFLSRHGAGQGSDSSLMSAAPAAVAVPAATPPATGVPAASKPAEQGSVPAATGSAAAH